MSKKFVAKMRSSISYDSTWYSKVRENVLLRKATTHFSLLSDNATTSTYFDTLSTKTKIYFIPYKLTKGPMKLMPQTSNNFTSIILVKGMSWCLEIDP